MFSKSCEYGIRALIFIAKESKRGKKVSPSVIAEEIGSPVAFTAKILQKLVKEHILLSLKGPHGGFYISDEGLRKTSLTDIVRAIDGDSVYKGCGLGLPKCDEHNPCPLHTKFMRVRADLKKMLDGSTLEELAFELENGHASLKLDAFK
ncbi:RrF2 family transcriptional regulator [Ulvibacter litoralis]|uniref:Rrf2 family protein n=1 Tax=Ulvibacter litoralis TaxID=227084 RepID=A0A1G7CH68_9FLAO|nr:Rrf2 family transcriptional regulator [Ulvibacter litoralis]GHC47569.1 hypothetical protein GCM10008083_08480 [Ulvibacter litoralis]SDE38070.1 Rrf2 family protein [Ulvibacter litoralis]